MRKIGDKKKKIYVYFETLALALTVVCAVQVCFGVFSQPHAGWQRIYAAVGAVVGWQEDGADVATDVSGEEPDADLREDIEQMYARALDFGMEELRAMGSDADPEVMWHRGLNVGAAGSEDGPEGLRATGSGVGLEALWHRGLNAGAAGSEDVMERLRAIDPGVGSEAMWDMGSPIAMEDMYSMVIGFGLEDIFTGTGSLISPLNHIEISSSFGSRGSRRHLGVDMRSPRGTPIHAAEDGVVTTAKYKGSYGNLIILNHGRGLETYYAHCSSMSVSVKQVVKKGDVIGLVGTTGNATGAHLHFEVRLNGVYQNPLNYF